MFFKMEQGKEVIKKEGLSSGVFNINKKGKEEKMRKMAVILAVLVWANSAFAMAGAIFTTLEDGTAVNRNIYGAMEDVYLDGGPGPNAPIGAAGLPEGDYYFQVTDPSGKVLLSEDEIQCRCFHVNADGVIDGVCPAIAEEKVRGKTTQVECSHATGLDVDHGAVTVQLMPYSKTPHPGGVYKVWITRFRDYRPGSGKHGFIPRYSKTDNFKVRKGKPYEPPIIIIGKFRDSDANGVIDPEEEELFGWQMFVEDPLGVTNTVYTEAVVMAVPEGTWYVQEDLPDDWQVTGAYIDGASQAVDTQVSVNVAGASGETHKIIFLNCQLGSITACKRYGKDTDGVPIEGFKICLEGMALNGTAVSECKLTGPSGCVTFDDLLPGSYTVTEVLPEGWYAGSETSYAVELAENEDESVSFRNYCKGTATMHTKGFWQNQGCTIVTAEDLDYLASLPPYQAGEIDTNGQDNCGDVKCPDSVFLPLATVNDLGCYIVAPNSQPQDPRIGLAQQLMAFILNCRHWADLNATLLLPSGSANVQDIIDQAVSAWETGQDASLWQSFLDGINNMGTVDIIYGEPCSIVY